MMSIPTEVSLELAAAIAQIKAESKECHTCFDTLGPFREICGKHYCLACLKESYRETEDGFAGGMDE